MGGLENCVKLEYLFCVYNNLETLDALENCVKLGVTFCTNNNLSMFDEILFNNKVMLYISFI